MMLSGGNDIIVAALADLHGGLPVQATAASGPSTLSPARADRWGLIWSLSGLFGHGEPDSEEASPTADILEMWRSIEASFDRLGSADKDRVRAANHEHDLRFGNFGVNRERPYEILEHMIDGVGRWQEFFQPHDSSPSVRLKVHRAMYRAYEAVRLDQEEPERCHLTADQIIRIVRAGQEASEV